MVLTRRRWWLRLLIAAGIALLLAVRVIPAAPAAGPADPTVAAAQAAPGDDGGGGGEQECGSGGGGGITGFLAGLGGRGACKAGKAITGAVKDAAGAGFQAVAKSFAQGWVKMLSLSLAWFVKIPTPQFSGDSVIQEIQRATVQLQLYGLLLSILIGSWRLVMARRQAVMQNAEESFMGLAKAVFGAWMFGGVLTAMTAGFDALANWALEQGTKDNPNLLNNLAAANLASMGSGLILVIAVCGILGGILQAVLLVGRQAMLAVVVALIPIAGASGGTQIGKVAFSRMMQWTIALLLWKPVAAMVYWVAFRLAGHDVKGFKDVQMALMGMILLSLAALVLPMLVKLVSGGAAMTGGSGMQAGMMAAGAVAAAGTVVATGGAGAAAGAGAASTGSAAGATAGPMGGPAGAASGGGGGGGLSGGTGSPGGGSGPSGGGGGGLSGGTGSPGGGSGPTGGGGGGLSGGTGSPAGGGSSAPPPPPGHATPAAAGGNSQSGTGGSGGLGVGDLGQMANAGSTMMQSSESVFDDNYESALAAQGGGYR